MLKMVTMITMRWEHKGGPALWEIRLFFLQKAWDSVQPTLLSRRRNCGGGKVIAAPEPFQEFRDEGSGCRVQAVDNFKRQGQQLSCCGLG